MWLARKFHSRFFRGAVALSQVARTARGRHIFPHIHTATRTWHHMVNRVGDSSAILTTVIVTGKYSSTRQCCSPMVRHLDNVAKSNYQWTRQGEVLGANFCAIIFNDVGFVGQN